jgi:glycosyltransferase involved in cell wall biosynthesis
MPETGPIHILFLSRWYPSRVDPMSGLFIQKQAEALAATHRVTVVHVQPDPCCQDAFETELATEKNVGVIRVYYRLRKSTFFGTAIFGNLVRYILAWRKGIRLIRKMRIDIVHAHILTRTGVIGYWLARRSGKPLILSEHWSRYFPEQDWFNGWFRRSLTRFIFARAHAVIAVSEKLKQAMQSHRLHNSNWHIVPNIVEPGLFFPETDSGPLPGKCIVHVSCFNEKSKNISGFLEAVQLVRQNRTDFHCLLVGEGPDLDQVKRKAEDLGLTRDCVEFTGMKTGNDLAAIYRKAGFTVISSRFETFGTVVIESIACGTPVVSTAVGIAPEIVSEKNGILVQSHDPRALGEAISQMIDRCSRFNRADVSGTVGKRFTPESVGRQLTEVYLSLIQSG